MISDVEQSEASFELITVSSFPPAFARRSERSRGLCGSLFYL